MAFVFVLFLKIMDQIYHDYWPDAPTGRQMVSVRHLCFQRVHCYYYFLTRKAM